MKNKGITFNICSETEAYTILNKINYYFKLASYRTNFVKNSAGIYQDLDFAYLTDLASIDFQLRDFLMDLSLDIEHSIKVTVLNLISNIPEEDGYCIIQEFREKFPRQYELTLVNLSKNRYLRDMYKKHHEKLAVWVFLEVTTFGILSMFIDFYYEKYPTKRIKNIKNYLKFIKNIRNACAHSNPLVLNLFSSKEFLRYPSAPVKLAASRIGIQHQYLRDLKVNDLVSLFYLHRNLQSKKMGEHRWRQGQRLIRRCHRHTAWYANNPQLAVFFKILAKLIDYLNMN